MGELMKKAFDNKKYLTLQKEHIMERINMFGGKLYLELGGKLFDDLHFRCSYDLYRLMKNNPKDSNYNNCPNYYLFHIHSLL